MMMTEMGLAHVRKVRSNVTYGVDVYDIIACHCHDE